jgi:hypothetical protein
MPTLTMPTPTTPTPEEEAEYREALGRFRGETLTPDDGRSLRAMLRSLRADVRDFLWIGWRAAYDSARAGGGRDSDDDWDLRVYPSDLEWLERTAAAWRKKKAHRDAPDAAAVAARFRGWFGYACTLLPEPPPS